MTAILTICGRKFECVPGTNVLKELTGKGQDAVEFVTLNASDTKFGSRAANIPRDLSASFFSTVRDGRGAYRHKIVAVVAFATCFAILGSPTNWLRSPVLA